MNLLLIIVIAVSLSMDAFSLALSIGTMSFDSKTNLILSSVVGIFHFFMPIIGSVLGSLVAMHMHLDLEFMEGVIFGYIAYEMFKDFRSGEEKEFRLSRIGIIVFALGVSLDSFGVGFVRRENMVLSSFIFSLTSFVFTFVGLNMGKKISNLIGKYSLLLGAFILSVLAIINFVNFGLNC